MFYYNNTKFRLFICGAKKEYEYVKEKFGYPKENVKYTGLARFDTLNTEKSNNKSTILICPTWRNWIKNQKDFDIFMDNYYNLLSNETLKEMLRKNNIKLTLIIHKNMKKFKLNRAKNSDAIIIKHNNEVDIQDEINKADLFITDYSSIFMDIAYRKVPMIFYQFDKSQYRQKQLEVGYFSYEENGFGDILYGINSLIKKIEYYINHNFELEDKYQNRINDFFEKVDKNNCKRILEEVEKI